MKNPALLFFTEENYYNFIGENTIKKYMGDIAIEIAEIQREDLLKVIDDYPGYNNECTEENIINFCTWLLNEFYKVYSEPASILICNAFFNIVQSYLDDKENFIKVLKEHINEIKQNLEYVYPYDTNTIEENIGNFFKAIEVNQRIYFHSYAYFIKELAEETTEPDVKRIFTLFEDALEFQRIEYKIAFLEGKFVPLYEINDLHSFLVFELYNIIEKELQIKKCGNCGKYFIPLNRSDTIYCDRISPKDSSLTCKEYGSQKLWYDKLKADKTAKLYRNIYMAKQMLVKRNPDIKEYQEDFDEFKTISKQWKKDVKEGVKTEEEFVAWLKSVRGKKDLD